MKAQIYAQATGRKAPEEQKPKPSIGPAEQALSLQTRIDWLNHDNTKKLFAELGKQVEALEAQARAQAVSYHQHQNPHLVIKCLIIADELRNTIERYGRPD